MTAYRTSRDVVLDVLADLDAWNLTPLQEIHHLRRISEYHRRLLDQAEQAEQTLADRILIADHFGRWFGITTYLLRAWGDLVGDRTPRASIHSEEAA